MDLDTRQFGVYLSDADRFIRPCDMYAIRGELLDQLRSKLEAAFTTVLRSNGKWNESTARLVKSALTDPPEASKFQVANGQHFVNDTCWLALRDALGDCPQLQKPQETELLAGDRIVALRRVFKISMISI